MDSITGNTVSADGDSNITDNSRMEGGEAPNNEADGEAENYIIDDTPRSTSLARSLQKPRPRLSVF